MTHPVVRFLLPLLAALLLATPARADQAVLEQLRTQQLALYATMRDFHMLTLLDGDPVRAAQLRKSVGDLGKSIDALPGNSANAELGAAIQAIRTAWPAFRKAALANDVAKTGHTESYVMVEMRSANGRLQEAINKAMAAIPAAGKRAQADRLQQTALLVAKITNEYTFIAADTSGGMAVAAGLGDQVDIEKLTLEVDRHIAAQLKEFAGRAEVYASLRSVSSKWNFVRRNLLDVSRASVPFVVDRYATQINDSYRLAIGAIERPAD